MEIVGLPRVFVRARGEGASFVSQALTDLDGYERWYRYIDVRSGARYFGQRPRQIKSRVVQGSKGRVSPIGNTVSKRALYLRSQKVSGVFLFLSCLWKIKSRDILSKT